MKDTLTQLVFILDRSGSMSSLVSDTIGGYNAMIEKQKKEPGEAVVTTVLFDDRYEVLHDRVPLQDIGLLTDKEYYARGNTALLDAVGRTVSSVGAQLNALPESERPGKVIVVITTDGLENSSHEYTKAQVKDMITHQQDKYSWTFIFLGANMDAVGEAREIGITPEFSRTYSASEDGTADLFRGMSDAVGAMRSPSYSRSSRNAAFASAMSALDEVEGRQTDEEDEDETGRKKRGKKFRK